ncbi:MAG: proline--tRNA ligase [Desulfobacterota bacterium]|nr:proline--tRNA ligase [Thermodesulfobacteriota bacterium]MDW8001782.1 proline--tRNA ligase [Deltaproteobacteria bacterium]
MRFSRVFYFPLKEDPKDAEVISHKLMVRASFIMRLSSGIYSWLPLGLKCIRKIENIIRDEMNKKGAQEILMPIVQPKELWTESKRWEKYGKELLRFRDRNERELCLAPTHEEVVTDIARREIRSYRDMPLILYQIHTKFRDEIRPRFGVMRAREFVMKDAYSFDRSEEDAEKSYAAMYDAYANIFRRCGLTFTVVEADTGEIGGSFSHEFMVLAETGEDIIFFCEKCGYSANHEKAEIGGNFKLSGKRGNYKKVLTPNKRKVEEVAEYLNVPKERILKTLLYKSEKGTFGVLIRGDREVNETKLKNLLNLDFVELLSGDEIERITGAPLGFSGPLGLSIPLYADKEVGQMEDFVVGGNEADTHILGVNVSDLEVRGFYDLRYAQIGDPCPRCEGSLLSKRGIEVGHIFKLGTKYSEAMNAKFLDRDGREKYIVMGCYGIGVGRTLAAAIEQKHDKNGMILPISIAPFEVTVLPINVTDSYSMEVAERVYTELIDAGVDALLDDRDERPGVKFKDCDLIGVPIRVTIGEKNLKEGYVEIKMRDSENTEKVKKEEVVRRVNEYVRKHKSN